MNHTYRIELSSLGGERIYRNFRYIREGDKVHREYAAGIYNNLGACLNANKRLNGGQNVLDLEG